MTPALLRRAGLLTAGLLLAATPRPAQARVKLLTLPVRSAVEIHLEQPGSTLVEEERLVPLVKGKNQVDFSWANTRIDPATIVFRVLAESGGVQARVISVSYPPNEQALVWSVYAPSAGAARVRISYLLGGLGRSYSYRAVTSADESTLTLRRYLRLSNQANEGFEQATLRMEDGRKVDTPVQLNQTRKVLVDRYPEVPVRKTYTADLGAYGYLDAAEKKLRVPMHYVLQNSPKYRLGKAPLPAGKVRIFQTDSRGTEAFLGEDWGGFTPIGDEMRLYLGVAQDVVVRRHIESRKNHTVQGSLRHVEVVIRYEVENFKAASVRLDVVESIAKLRTELGLRAGLQPEISFDKRSTFKGPFVDEASGLTEIRMHKDLRGRRGDKAPKHVERLHLTFRNEW